ncbi:hypothetical protein KGF56_001846 [Candida oxycetoniae]|uniref:Uncharacterized protein n=1 Tax=Candida oxycetoniae TaxID=497107 RepID=A0AAI9WYS4_9ASCO|nr:uncharacterized protein KGF56_001846 [Candida oxycetoniae]KAI3405349.2 hypothetical protein KGF56_001846 [Candida oxycetoniae]
MKFWGSKNTTNAMQVASEVVESEFETRFTCNRIVHRKTEDQHHIMAQLEGLCYILIFYQFSKFCYNACLIPTLCHIVQLTILNHRLVISSYANIFLQALSEDVDNESRINTLRGKIPTICNNLYFKTVFVLVYHTLFVCTWMVSLVNEEKLSQLENGTWWFISFIGEKVPVISPQASFWIKIVKLGLPQLLILDLVILFLQLILLQCIFKQSSVFRGGRTMGDKEVYLIRSRNSGYEVQGDDSLEDYGQGVILALKVRLYETFQFDSFST